MFEKEAEELIQRVEMANSMNCFMQLTPDRKQIAEMLVMIAEPREKRIKELEVTNKNISNECHKLVDSLEKKQNEVAELENKLEQTEKDLADYQFNYPTIKELQKENAELKKKILDIQDAVTMQMYTNKANEWHYVKDGDLPSDRHGHVVINQDWDKVTIRNGRFEYLDGYKANVIAWKEIVLPKESE